MTPHSLLTLAQAATSSADTSDTLVMWSIVLIGMAVILFILELLIPSGGLIGTGAGVCLVIGCVLLCFVDPTIGMLVSIAFLAALPFAFLFAMKIWPNTPLGKILILRSAQDMPTESPDDAGDVRQDESQKNGLVVGTVGKAVTDLHPIGTCVFDGKREQCLAAGGVIDAGSRVKITAIDGMQVRVRAERG